MLRLSRRYGHQLSLTAGIDYATGDTVTVMDGDLQHPPEVVLEMIAAWRQGADVVFAIKQSSAVESAVKRFTARAFYRTMRTFASVDIPAQAQDFRLMSRRATDALRLDARAQPLPAGDGGLDRLRAGVHRVHSRGPLRWYHQVLNTADATACLDGLFSFSTRPLALATWVGFIMAFLGLAYAVVLHCSALGEVEIPGWTSLLVAVLLIGGIQLITLGVMGEYIGRIYEEIQGRPLYLVENEIGFPSAGQGGEAPQLQLLGRAGVGLHDWSALECAQSPHAITRIGSASRRSTAWRDSWTRPAN